MRGEARKEIQHLPASLIVCNQEADSLASSAASSSRSFFKEGGGLGTMLFFHFRSSFLDILLLIPSSTSLSRLTVSILAI